MNSDRITALNMCLLAETMYVQMVAICEAQEHAKAGTEGAVSVADAIAIARTKCGIVVHPHAEGTEIALRLSSDSVSVLLAGRQLAGYNGDDGGWLEWADVQARQIQAPALYAWRQLGKRKPPEPPEEEEDTAEEEEEDDEYDVDGDVVGLATKAGMSVKEHEEHRRSDCHSSSAVVSTP